MRLFAGLDIGSLTTDAALIEPHGRLIGWAIVPTGAGSAKAARAALDRALALAGAGAEAVVRTVATGYGRQAQVGADKTLTEISCHAAGAHFLFPQARTVIDIGGQDSKVIRLGEDGRVIDFQMNDKCAAGTGRFLEVMAAKLELGLDDLGRLSLAAEREVEISSVCTVFAESEVVSLVARDEDRAAIVKGLNRAVVNRVWAMVKRLGPEPEVTMSGGVAKNAGVTALLEERLGRPLLIAPEPQLVGALGAALKARELD